MWLSFPAGENVEPQTNIRVETMVLLLPSVAGSARVQGPSTSNAVGVAVVCLLSIQRTNMVLVRILLITNLAYPSPPHNSFIHLSLSQLSPLPLPDGDLHLGNTSLVACPFPKAGHGASLWLPTCRLDSFLDGESRRAVMGGYQMKQPPPNMFYTAKATKSPVTSMFPPDNQDFGDGDGPSNRHLAG
jgi:hypothetical protein